MAWEVEQKFRVDDTAAVAARLESRGVDPLSAAPQTQLDYYFAHPARDFAQTDEALRLRQVGDDNKITYKGPKIDAHTKTRREIELPLAAGPASLNDWSKLLAALGFRRVASVEKVRRTTTLTSAGKQVELAWDEVVGLGLFVELELQSDEAGLDDARACLASLAADLGLRQVERRSYLELLLEQKSLAVQ